MVWVGLSVIIGTLRLGVVREILLFVLKGKYPVFPHSRPYNNVIEAAAAGASSAISLVANVAANLIAFVALLYFADSALSWFGAFICYPELSFQVRLNMLIVVLNFLEMLEFLLGFLRVSPICHSSLSVLQEKKENLGSCVISFISFIMKR